MDQQWYSENREGSGRWARDADCQAAGLFTPSGVYIGQSPDRGYDMTLSGDAPMTLIGGSGTGKNADLLAYGALYPGNMVTLDPKLENASVTGRAHMRAGKELRCINPTGRYTGAPWHLPMDRVNPLDILKPDSPTLDEDTHMILEASIPLPLRDQFFEIRARQWAAAHLKHFIVRYGECTLPDLFRVMTMIEGNPEGYEALAREELLTSPLAETRNAATEILYKRKASEREFSAVMGTFKQHMGTLYYQGPRETLTEPTFSLKDLTKKPMVLYLGTPAEHAGIWAGILRVIIAVAITYKRRAPSAGSVLYLMDELATLKRFEMAERLYSYERGGGNRMVGLFQSLGQIREYYGHEGEQVFLSSSQARLFKGVRDLQTAQMISNMLGSMTLEVDDKPYQANARLMKQQLINDVMFGGADPYQAGMHAAHWQREAEFKKKIFRRLLEPAEVLALPQDRMIGFVSGESCPPILARTTPYYKRRDLAGYFMPHPEHG